MATTLPNEILSLIFDHLNVSSLIAAGRTCRQWWDASNDEKQWKRLAREWWCLPNDFVPPGGLWKDLCRDTAWVDRNWICEEEDCVQHETLDVEDDPEGAIGGRHWLMRGVWSLDAAFTHQGQWIVGCGTSSGKIMVFDAAHGHQARHTFKLDRKINAVVLMAGMGVENETWLASASTDHSIRVWSTHSGEPIWENVQAHSKSVLCLCSAPFPEHAREVATQKALCGKWGVYGKDPTDLLLSGGHDNDVRVWSAEKGEEQGQLKGATGAIIALAWVPWKDDKMVIIGASFDGHVRLWLWPGGELVGDVLCCEGSEVGGISLNEDRSLLAACGYDGSVRVFRMNPWNKKPWRVWNKAHSRPVISLSIRNGWLASASQDRSLRVFDLQSGKCIRILEGHEDWVRVCMLHPREDVVLSGSYDATVKSWSIRTGNQLQSWKWRTNDHWIRAFAWCDPSMLAVGGTDGLTLVHFNRTIVEKGEKEEEDDDGRKGGFLCVPRRS